MEARFRTRRNECTKWCHSYWSRDFLVAYNVNLNTVSERKANSVAFDVREAGRVMKKAETIMRDENGEALREPGKLKCVKGIGWFIEEYGIAQVSMNLTNLQVTSLHEAFEACCESATRRGMRVTGSELVGLVPKNVMLEAGRYFLKSRAGLLVFQKRNSSLLQSNLWGSTSSHL